jgi:hypothetical protein
LGDFLAGYPCLAARQSRMVGRMRGSGSLPSDEDGSHSHFVVFFLCVDG